MSAFIGVHQPEFAVASGDQPVSDCQSQAGALARRTGGKEGIEDLVADIGVDAGTAVTHVEVDMTAL